MQQGGNYIIGGRCQCRMDTRVVLTKVIKRRKITTMLGFCSRFLAAGLLALAVSFTASADVPFQRVANISLTNFPTQPPQFGYTVTNAFSGLSFSQPVCISSPPGETNRLFVLEKTGKIVVVTNLASPNRSEFMTLTVDSNSESGLLGLAFHPDFASNGYFFVFSSRTLSTSQGNGLHQCISRFQVTPTNANVALPTTEQFLIRQFDSAGNHNGGDLHFGHDGYLYASIGDEGAQYNGNGNAQVITNKFFSAILRLDVDKQPGNLLPNPHPANSTNYFIPADNPYIGVTNFNGKNFAASAVRTEFYSIGYRNPWRMSFDPITGFLYVADVGQDIYEEINVVTNGANAGWSYFEGLHLAKTNYPSQPNLYTNPPAGLLFPIQEYSHTGTASLIGQSVSGGFVYRGTKISQLYGAYIFGDYVSGNIWMLRYDGTNTTPYQYLASATTPAAFGRDPRNGDILICQYSSGQIGRIEYNSTPVGLPLPATLANTGAFSDLTTLTPSLGVVAYDINTPFWSDNAIKTRWFSVPNTNLTITFNPVNNWSFPTGTVWMKHFELELTNGVPQSRKRLETRFIIKNTNGVYGVTYRWNSATNATLVAEAGLDENITINDGGNLRTQMWHYPSRSECLACHTAQSGYAPSFNTAQINRDYSYSVTTNQIEALRLAGYFNNAITNRHLFPALAHATNDSVSVEYRVRSYLAANCAQCHQPGVILTTFWDARINTTTPFNKIINGELNNDFGNTNNRVVAPGSLTNSILFQRVANMGPGHMPPLGTTVVNSQAVNLLAAWITNTLPNYVSYETWQSNYFGSTNIPNAAKLADPDGDNADNYLEYLTGTDPIDLASGWGISITASNNTAVVIIPQIANRAFEIQSTTNLFDPISWRPLNNPANSPFYPSSNRTVIVPDPIQSELPQYYRSRVFEP